MRRLVPGPWRLVGLGALMTLALVAGGTAAAAPGLSLNPPNGEAEDRVVITIQGRTFEPKTLAVQAGRLTRLVLHNSDAELHTFVPVGLLTGSHLNIFGNGAPQFDESGLKRVIIPSQGTTEILFVPTRRGLFPYFCDMPGHAMSATIVVE